MKKAIKLLFSVSCFSMLSLSACGGNTPPAHEHTWSGGWSSDATNHWHECEACGAKKDEAAHEYDDDHDTTCECGYVRDIGDHAPKSTWSRNGTHHWHACTHEGCELKFDYEEHQLNVVGGCIDCYYSFETIYYVDQSTQSCDIAFNNLEAKTYYFWVSDLSVDLTYQIRFPWDQVVNCYYYASASATVLSSMVYDFKYDNPSYISLPSAHYTDFFFNFTVGQDKVGKNYTGISVRSFDV